MIKAKVILYKSKVLKDGKSPLMLRITKGTARKYISIGFSISDSEWNESTGKPKGRSHTSMELSRIIQNIELNALQKIQELSEKNKNVSLDEICFALKDSKDNIKVLTYWEKIINSLEKSGKIGNSKAYKNTYGVFKNFCNGKELDFTELDLKTILKFEEYLLKKGLKINSISFNMRTLRAVFNRAVKEEITSKENYPFSKYSIKKEKTRHRALTKEQIKNIKELELNNMALDKARDYFMFSFYLRGISFIDFAYLKKENIINDRLQYMRSKTGQLFSIKLTHEANEIIKKYSEHTNNSEYIFPIIKSKATKYQDYRKEMGIINKKLKIIGELTSCPIPLTSYVTRHSWATIAKRGGIATAVISEGLGHTTEQITQVYLDSFENKVLDEANEMITSFE